MKTSTIKFGTVLSFLSLLLWGILNSPNTAQAKTNGANGCTVLPLPTNLTYIGGLNDGTRFLNGFGNAVRVQRMVLGTTDVLVVAVGQKVNGSGTFEIYFLDPNTGALLDGTNIGSPTDVQPHISTYVGVPIRSISGGDVNGDGAPDFVLGSPHSDAFALVGVVSNGILNYQLLTLPAPANSNGFGASTAMGDLDGLTGDEIAVGATGGAVGNTTYVGRVSLYKFNGLTFDNTQTISSPIPNPRLDDSFGSSVAIGNVTGGAENDLIVGASGSTVNSTASAGRIYIFPGPINPSNYQTLTTGTRNDQFGSSVITSNVDGGLSDVVGATSGSSTNPRANVYSGSTFSGELPDFILQPLAGRNTTIWGVRDSGDLNGDGFDDVIASAPASCGGTTYLSLSNVSGPFPLTTRLAFQTPVSGTSEFGWAAAIAPRSRLIFVADTLTTVGSAYPNNGQVYVFKLN